MINSDRLKQPAILEVMLNQYNTQQGSCEQQIMHRRGCVTSQIDHSAGFPGLRDRSSIPTLHCHSNSLDYVMGAILLLAHPFYSTELTRLIFCRALLLMLLF